MPKVRAVISFRRFIDQSRTSPFRISFFGLCIEIKVANENFLRAIRPFVWQKIATVEERMEEDPPYVVIHMLNRSWLEVLKHTVEEYENLPENKDVNMTVTILYEKSN